jgi:hypothetical protein
MVPDQPSGEELLATGTAEAAVVAEAVAVAMQAVAEAANKALAQRALEVAHAAQRVADAADAARAARETAAVAAAQALARDVELTARLVQAQADKSAAQFQHAAATAARDRARSLAFGTLPDEAHQASLLASRLTAMAEATAQDTRTAAAVVAAAAVAAASALVLARGTAEREFDDDVTKARSALGHQTTMAAARVARTTDSHARGVALVAREAAAAVMDPVACHKSATG